LARVMPRRPRRKGAVKSSSRDAAGTTIQRTASRNGDASRAIEN
jgi:hypothetical protein